ncbi:importin subunit alpha-6/7 [Sarotherodon galilaeus]
MLRLEDEASSGLEASAAAGLPPPPMAAFAVALKLPDFWLHNPPSWFVHVEAQFALRGVSADDTKYHHVVASLDPLSTRRVMTLLRDPPAQGKYTALKALLLRRYSLSDAERAEKLLSLAGLGDGTALELMESMLSLLAAGSSARWPCQLPAIGHERLPLPCGRGGSHPPGYQKFRRPGDCPGFTSRFPRPLTDAPGALRLVHGGWNRCTAAPRKRALFLSPAFWSEGTALSPALQFPDPGKRARQRSVAAATAGNKERLLFIEDSRSGRRFLVDSGSQKSLLPPAGSDRLAEGCGPLLTAANGSPIKTFGERTTPRPPAFEPPPAFPARLRQPCSQDGPSSACSLPPRFSRSGRLLRPRVLD